MTTSGSDKNTGLPLYLLQIACLVLFVGGYFLQSGEKPYFTKPLPDWFFWGTATVWVSSAPWFSEVAKFIINYFMKKVD